MENIFFFISVFFAGLLSFFSPCILPLLPVYAGVLLDDSTSNQGYRQKGWFPITSLVKTSLFIVGISFVFIVLGYGVSLLGNLLYAPWFRWIMGGIIIFLGLHQMEILQLKILYKEKRIQLKNSQKKSGYSQAFLLGLTFSFAWTPCVGPVLGSVLALAASGGAGAWQGALLMFVYTLGLALPFLILAVASTYVLKYFRRLHPYLGILKKVGGFLILLMGFLVLFGNVAFLTQIFE